MLETGARFCLLIWMAKEASWGLGAAMAREDEHAARRAARRKDCLLTWKIHKLARLDRGGMRCNGAAWPGLQTDDKMRSDVHCETGVRVLEVEQSKLIDCETRLVEGENVF